ncbi:MAG: DUF6805 domain-containing protein, partial [Paludibacteraceae bacterium]
ARPQHYRVYSSPNEAMWCCVGTGMENHEKYGEFIYTRQHDSLYVNLFVPSELNWEENGYKIRQETNFPDEAQTKLIITNNLSKSLKLFIRYPKWVAIGALKIIVNTDTLSFTAQPSSYVMINRTWQTGDSIKVLLPMSTTIEQLPNVSKYIAFMHGPILLGAKTSTKDLSGLVADDSRWGHIANGSLEALDKAPIIVGDDRNTFASKLIPVEGKPLTFTAPDLFPADSFKTLTFEPFFRIHDARYMMYWMTLKQSEYQHVIDSLAVIETLKLELENRTIDDVATGEQQPEVDHAMQSSNSYSGNHQNEFWRDARDGGYFSYSLATNGERNLSLFVRYWGNESGNRTFDILIDGIKLTSENISRWKISGFVNQEYPIPNSMIEGKKNIRITFQSQNITGYVAGGVFYLRLLRQPLTPNLKPVSNALFDFGTTTSPLVGDAIQISENSYLNDSYGWFTTTTNNIISRDRGTTANDELRDFCMSSIRSTFKVFVENGTYHVTLKQGDMSYAHDMMSVSVNGVTKIPYATSALGNFDTNEFDMDTDQNMLVFSFADVGGTDINWVVNSLKIEKINVDGLKEISDNIKLAQETVITIYDTVGKRLFYDKLRSRDIDNIMMATIKKRGTYLIVFNYKGIFKGVKYILH